MDELMQNKELILYALEMSYRKFLFGIYQNYTQRQLSIEGFLRQLMYYVLHI